MRTRKDFAGVSIPFFVASIEALTKEHGQRTCARIEELRAALERAEEIWLGSPPYEPEG